VSPTILGALESEDRKASVAVVYMSSLDVAGSNLF
jgi:hypothetical protein